MILILWLLDQYYYTKERLKKIFLHKYIGESARSAYESSLEQVWDYQEMKLDSRVMKHYLDRHEVGNM